MRDGDIGFAEAFLDGQWQTPDLAGLLTLLARNREALDAPLYGSWYGRLAHRLVHLLRSNTRAGSRRNIAAHYDLGNDFYSLWLDPGMTYSSALFEHPAMSLESAQDAKYARILDELQLAPQSRVLEIGCGWGGFASLCTSHGHQLTGVSLSQRQLDYAGERLRLAAASGQARLEYRDYRDIQGRYDAVASIEMVEAVGERWWPAYFSKIAEVLPTGGRAVVQSILIEDALFDRYRRGSDFIQQYVFPGGMLASERAFAKATAGAGLQLHASEAFGRDYAETLRRWLKAFTEAEPRVRGLGFDDRFIRMWRFYLCYCAAGFDSGRTDVLHFELSRPLQGAFR
jgi:cyclopropane-fatty-acyl-phospholipid synthase